MLLLHRHRLGWIAGAATLALLSAIGLSAVDRPAWAQTRTIRIVTPVPPGGTTDILARLLADQVGRRPGISVLVENRPGAGTVIGDGSRGARGARRRDAADPHQPGVPDQPAPARRSSYDPLTSFDPVCQHGELLRPVFAVQRRNSALTRRMADLLAAWRGPSPAR